LLENATGIGGGRDEGEGGGGTCEGQLIWFNGSTPARHPPIKPQICGPLCDPSSIHRRFSREAWLQTQSENLKARIRHARFNQDAFYAVFSNRSRPISMRRISLVPAPIS
jgi:hypothetical protein